MLASLTPPPTHCACKRVTHRHSNLLVAISQAAERQFASDGRFYRLAFFTRFSISISMPALHWLAGFFFFWLWWWMRSALQRVRSYELGFFKTHLPPKGDSLTPLLWSRGLTFYGKMIPSRFNSRETCVRFLVFQLVKLTGQMRNNCRVIWQCCNSVLELVSHIATLWWYSSRVAYSQVFKCVFFSS